MRRFLLALTILMALAAAAGALAFFLTGETSFSGDVVLDWHLDRPIIDYAARPDWPWDIEGDPSSLIELYQQLAAARDDDDVVGLALHIHNARFGIAKAEQIRRLLGNLREAGKFVECYMETAGEGFNGTLAYYIATACESIRLAPGGDLNLLGLYADRTYLRGAFDKLKIDPQFAHVGKYKSGVERYTEYESSAAAEEALEAVLDGYYTAIISAIAAARDLDEATVMALVDGAPYSAHEALEAGLVDELAYPDQFGDAVDQRAGGDTTRLPIEGYGGSHASSEASVAIVFAQGSIRRGHGGVEAWTGALYIGSRDLGKLLHDLSEDDSISAVILRIDSPGGSALASDLILREVEMLAVEKPLVVSMSDVAASGGYYIGTKARHIVAEATTLTGSIGVYGGKLVTRQFEQELLGITHDTLKRGENADIYSSLETFSAPQRDRLESLMRGVYDTFVGHVAAGREMSIDSVEAVAQGRVWTGRDALDIGLIDAVGGFEEALRLTRQELGLDPGARLDMELYPRPPHLFDYLLGRAQPLLPVELRGALKALTDNHLNLLELPAVWADLAKPF